MKFLKKISALALSALMVFGLASTAFAATVPAATIDTDRDGSITIYKYDLTSAMLDDNTMVSVDSLSEATKTALASKISDGKIKLNDLIEAYQSDGIDNADLRAALSEPVVTADPGKENPSGKVLGNGQTSNGYAIKGVEYSYLKVANIVQYEETEADGTHKAMVLYEMDDTADAALLAALGLTNDNAYPVQSVEANGATKFQPVAGKHYFESHTLINALRAKLAENSTVLKNALEAYMAAQNAGKFAETDANGKTKIDIPAANQGLYLIVETKVPEMVTSTTDPFFVSVPMTTVNGSVAANGGQEWLYDVTLFPKNETGIPSLEKTVRESAQDKTGSVADAQNEHIWHDNNNGSPIDDGFAHNATGSDGDKFDYQLISKLPTITSEATRITNYTFEDTLSKGLEYNGNEAVQAMLKANFNANDVVIEFFKDAACTDANKVATWHEDDATAKFVVDYDPPVETGENAPSSDATRMQITMTEAGLDEINHANTVYTEAGALRKGYSDLYMRITYSATLNQNADVVYGDDGNPNTVTLKWQRSNMDYWDVLTDDAHVYTYGLDLTKQFSDGQGNFRNVQFKVFNKTDGYWVTAVESPAESGVWYVQNTDPSTDPLPTPAGWVAGYSDDDLSTGEVSATDESGELGTTFIPSATGVMKIYGLEDDEYIITEVQTDNGYTLLKENINVLISAADDATRPCNIYTVDENGVWQNKFTGEKFNGTPYDQDQMAHNMLTASAKVDGDPVSMEADNGSADALVPLTVINTKGFDLPKTGAEGTWMLSIAGIVGMAAVAFVIILVAKKNRKEEEDA